MINDANLSLIFVLMFDLINENNTEVENIYVWKLSAKV
jgi:hypothetical protein